MTTSRRRFLGSSAAALAGLSLWGLGTRAFGETSGNPPGAGEEILVFRNGTVLPVDAAFSEHSALAIRGNRILAVGDEKTVMAAAGKRSRKGASTS